MGYFDESETFKQSCLGGIKKEPIVPSPLPRPGVSPTNMWHQTRDQAPTPNFGALVKSLFGTLFWLDGPAREKMRKEQKE